MTAVQLSKITMVKTWPAVCSESNRNIWRR